MEKQSQSYKILEMKSREYQRRCKNLARGFSHRSERWIRYTNCSSSVSLFVCKLRQLQPPCALYNFNQTPLLCDMHNVGTALLVLEMCGPNHLYTLGKLFVFVLCNFVCIDVGNVAGLLRLRAHRLCQYCCGFYQRIFPCLKTSDLEWP